MKIFRKIIFAFIFVILLSCSNTTDTTTIYNGNDWIVKQLNDSTVICIPKQGDLFGRQPNKPYVINIKTFKESRFRE